MGISDEPPTKRRRTKKAAAPPTGRPAMPIDAINDLRSFIYYAMGDPHLSVWEENLINGAKYRLRRDVVYFTPKQEVKLAEIWAKLHYDQQHIPLPPIDPDELAENDDPDGWLVESSQPDEFAEVEDPEELLDEFGRDA